MREHGCYTELMRSVADVLREGTRRETAELSPEARVELAFRLGDSDLEALVETRGVSAADARAAFARSRRHGRRPSQSHGD